MVKNVQAVVLAAGKSTRLNSGRTKLIEKICGQEMVLFATKLFAHLDIPTTVVIGYQKELVQAAVVKEHGDALSFIIQEGQEGTAHAINCTRGNWHKDDILIMHADLPLVNEEVITSLVKQHQESNATISFVMAHNNDPASFSYSRVIKNGNHIQIVEAQEFNGDHHEHCDINAGIYIVRKSFLEEHINEIERHETSQEFFLTDLVKIASKNGCPIATISAPFDVIRGINTFQELWAVEQIKRAELIKKHMDNGVRFIAAQTVHIDLAVTIGSGTSIGSGVHLFGKTTIGFDCIIAPYSILTNAIIKDRVTINPHTVIDTSFIESQAQVGPFAHIKDQSSIGKQAIIGNFVEIKKSTIGDGSKAKHLSYLGDAEIGASVNIGAGTITCNHNGTTKNKTIIHDGSYLGSNSSLIAPVTVGKNSYVAAGSVITENVPSNALAIARSRQLNKENYAMKLRKKADEQLPDTHAFIAAVKLSNNDTNISE